MKYFMSFILLSFLVLQARAWGPEGHAIITQIAFNQLSDKTMTKIEGDLQGFNQFYPNYSNPLIASSWSDLIRYDNINTFSTWHYIDIPFNPTGDSYKMEVPEINVRWALSEVFNTLKQGTSVWGRNFMLRYLLHLVGDIHQPFHNIEYYSEQYPKGDMGGNLIKVWYNYQYTNLHAFWDSGGGKYGNKYTYPLDPATINQIERYAKELQMNHSKIHVTEVNVNNWSDEAHYIAKNFGYPGALNNRRLTDEYISNTRSICEEQFVKAGYRLAYLLNSIYGEEQDLPCVLDYCYLDITFDLF